MTEAIWEYEAADPEVGFFSDSITHTCEANIEGEETLPAEITSSSLHTVSHPAWGQAVAEIIVWTCPVCQATTSATEHWPLSFFEEPRDDDQ